MNIIDQCLLSDYNLTPPMYKSKMIIIWLIIIYFSQIIVPLLGKTGFKVGQQCVSSIQLDGVINDRPHLKKISNSWIQGLQEKFDKAEQDCLGSRGTD